MLSKLPEGWLGHRLGDILEISNDGISADAIAELAAVAHYSLPAFDDGRAPEITAGLNIKSNKSLVPPDCVLFSKLNPRIPRVWRVAERSQLPSVCSTEFWPLVARSDEIGLDFLTAFIGSEAFLGDPQITPSSSTNSHQRVDRRSFENYVLPLPPLDEQRRIAEVLRSASAACEAALQVIEKYGDVIQTEIDAVVADLIAAPAVPMVRLGDVAAVKGGKRLPKGSEYSDAPTGYRYVRVTDWNDHEIDPSYVRWISSEAASAIRRYTISSADLFISIAGSIGLTATVPPELDGAHLTENAAKIVLREDVEVDRDYLLLVMRSGSLTDQIRQQKGVGGGVPKLALFRIEALEVPLPPLSRQRKIAASYRSLKVARSNAIQASKSAIALREMLASDLLSGHVRVPA